MDSQPPVTPEIKTTQQQQSSTTTTSSSLDSRTIVNSDVNHNHAKTTTTTTITSGSGAAGSWKPPSSNITNNTGRLQQQQQQQQKLAVDPQLLLRRKVLQHFGLGVIVVAIPIGTWWYWSTSQREATQKQIQKTYESREQVPVAFRPQDTFDYLISNKMKPGDLLLFDRKCERCMASPWAMISCYVSKTLLTNIGGRNNPNYTRTVADGEFDHVGIIVPGYIKSKKDEYNDTNLLLMEATPSGIVARPVKERIEHSASRSILLLQLNCPGEERNKMDLGDDDDSDKKSETSKQISVRRTRDYMNQQLISFRDAYMAHGQERHYQYIHSTVTFGGAIAYALGLQDYIAGPVNPAAFLTLTGLQKAAAAVNINVKENHNIKVEDYLRNYRLQEHDAIRLRPGYRFLAPVPIKEK